jgi:hypothetical protein
MARVGATISREEQKKTPSIFQFRFMQSRLLEFWAQERKAQQIPGRRKQKCTIPDYSTEHIAWKASPALLDFWLLAFRVTNM